MIYIFLADGFEEIEALTVVDILRRANAPVNTVGVPSKEVTGTHNIKVITDIEESEALFTDLTAIILPGGMPGTKNLDNSKTVHKFIDYAVENNILIAAICAAPSILGKKGLLVDKRVTCFPGFENTLFKAKISDDFICEDNNIITAKAAGVAAKFAFKIISRLYGDALSIKIRSSMYYI
jgi:protein deglycase